MYSCRNLGHIYEIEEKILILRKQFGKIRLGDKKEYVYGYGYEVYCIIYILWYFLVVELLNS